MNTNEQLLQDVQAIVAKSIPAMQAKEFADFVRDSNAQTVELAQAKKANAEAVQKINQLETEKRTWGNATDLMAKAEAKEKQAEAKEYRMEVDVLKIRLEAEQSKVSHSAGILAMIAKNPRAIEIMSHSESTSQPAYPGPNGNMIYPASTFRDERKVTESVVTKAEGEARHLSNDQLQ